MDSPIFFLLAGLLVGFVLGILAHRLLFSSAARNRRLEVQVDHLQRQNESFQAQVAQHFTETSALLGRIHPQFRALLAHLASGAEKLGGNTDLRQQLTFSDSVPPASPYSSSREPVEAGGAASAPLDYALRKGSNDSTLVEGYGLQQQPPLSDGPSEFRDQTAMHASSHAMQAPSAAPTSVHESLRPSESRSASRQPADSVADSTSSRQAERL